MCFYEEAFLRRELRRAGFMDRISSLAALDLLKVKLEFSDLKQAAYKQFTKHKPQAVSNKPLP